MKTAIMNTTIKAKPKKGLILTKIEPEQENVDCHLNIDLSTDISLAFDFEDGFDPDVYMNAALSCNREGFYNLMYQLHTNREEPSDGIVFQECYLASPNLNFFRGITLNGVINPLICTLQEIAFPIQPDKVRERESSYPAKKPRIEKEFPEADDGVYWEALDTESENEVILPIGFKPEDYKQVVEALKMVGTYLERNGYRQKHTFISIASRAKELAGITGKVPFDATFLYSGLNNNMGINICPRDGLGGIREADPEVRVQKSRDYLSTVFDFPE